MKQDIKKLSALIIAISMMLSMFACNTNQKTDESKQTEKPTEAIQSTEPDTEEEPNVETESNEDDKPSQTEPEDTSDKESNTVEESETKCEHPYAASPDGHWKPACDVCGKGEGKMQDHDIYEKIKDQGDRLAYLYLCSICDYVVFKQELSYDINVYIPPTDLAATRCYGYSGAYYFEDNVGYTRFLSSGAPGIIYAYEDTACEDVSGRYLIMKVRMSGGSSMSLTIQSSVAKNAISVTPCEIGEDWCTLIIDMAAIGNGKTTGYVPDGGGDYYLSLLDIYLDGNTLLPAGGYLDISYITVVETLEDARDFAAENDVLYIYDNVMMNPFPSIEGGACDHKYIYNDSTHSMSACEICGAEAITDESHKIVENVKSGVYTYSCKCGYQFDTSKTVSDAVNTFLSPSFIAKHADNSAIWSGGELMFEDGGEPYARIYGKHKDTTGKNITDDKKIWNIYYNGVDVTGQYLVIKYRIPDNDLIYTADGSSKFNQSQIRIYTSTQRGGATDEKDGFYLPVSENNQWQVAIINLAFSVGNSSGSTFVAAEDGTYTMRFLQMRLFYGGFSTESDYTDIAYIGFCDKLEEAVSLVNEDEYYWQCQKGERKGYTVNKAEGPDPSDEIPEVTEPETEPETEPIVEHIVKETVKDGVYSYTCSHCDKEICDITVPGTTNKFYSPSQLANNSGYNNINHLAIDDNGVLFTRITGKSGSSFEYYFVNRSGAPATDAGAFRYIVLRMRVSNASKHVNLVFQMENVDTSIRINNSMKSGEWMTVVIDMDKIAKITANSDGSYKIKHWRLYTGDMGVDSVDIAYVALCDDWSEVAPLAVDEQVTLVTHTSTAGGKVNAADGSCANHVPIETVKSGTYSYFCSSCGQTINEKSISEDVNLFISPGSLGSTYGFNSTLTSEGDLVFKRFTSTGSAGHIYVRNKAALADTGKFLIVKMRLNNTSAFVMEAGAAALSGVSQEPVLKKGEWQTVVIDLSSYANYMVDTENGDVQIRFTVYGSAGFTVDVAYVAIVDDKAEAITVIEEATYDHYVNWKKTPSVIKADQATCDVCAVTETVSGNTYSYSICPICGRSFADATKVISEDVTKYYSAGALASMSQFNGIISLGADASGEVFARIKSSNGNAMEYYIVNKSSSPATDLGEATRYIVFKVRMSDIKCEYNFSIVTKDGKGGVISLHVTMKENNEWVTIVADMDAIAKLEANSGGDYALKSFFMYTSATGENTLDIACVAFCNTWEEIANVSGDDSAMLMTVRNGMGKIVSTVDGSEITE